MELIFADAFYWIALANPSDEWHRAARKFDEKNQNILVTSEEILVEFLNYFAESGPYRRQQATEMIDLILDDQQIISTPQTSESFHAGLFLYKNRNDKGYSLTDWISMELMRNRGITRLLTHDEHFSQEGFTILF